MSYTFMRPEDQITFSLSPCAYTPTLMMVSLWHLGWMKFALLVPLPLVFFSQALFLNFGGLKILEVFGMDLNEQAPYNSLRLDLLCTIAWLSRCRSWQGFNFISWEWAEGRFAPIPCRLGKNLLKYGRWCRLYPIHSASTDRTQRPASWATWLSRS